GRPGPVPPEFADGPAIFGRLLRLAGADEEIEPEAAVALGREPGALGDLRIELVGAHQLHRRRLQDPHSVERAAVEQHPREAKIIVHRRRDARAAAGQLAIAEVEAADVGVALAAEL